LLGKDTTDYDAVGEEFSDTLRVVQQKDGPVMTALAWLHEMDVTAGAGAASLSTRAGLRRGVAQVIDDYLARMVLRQPLTDIDIELEHIRWTGTLDIMLKRMRAFLFGADDVTRHETMMTAAIRTYRDAVTNGLRSAVWLTSECVTSADTTLGPVCVMTLATHTHEDAAAQCFARHSDAICVLCDFCGADREVVSVTVEVAPQVCKQRREAVLGACAAFASTCTTSKQSVARDEYNTNMLHFMATAPLTLAGEASTVMQRAVELARCMFPSVSSLAPQPRTSTC
jgi:hypothetical protein